MDGWTARERRGGAAVNGPRLSPSPRSGHRAAPAPVPTGTAGTRPAGGRWVAAAAVDVEVDVDVDADAVSPAGQLAPPHPDHRGPHPGRSVGALVRPLRMSRPRRPTP
eukprot:scaffold4384_cov367-Prasinococcus_capsulatus_cf.AAC.4